MASDFSQRNLDPFLIPHTKIQWKWIIDLKVSPKTIKIFEENIGVNLHDLWSATSFFLDTIPKAQMTKEQIDKLEFIKI